MKPQEKIIFTTAQNQANINSGFIKNLEVFIKQKGIDRVYIFAVKGKSVMDNKPVVKKQKNWDTGKFELVTINEGKYGVHANVRKLVDSGLGGAKVEIIYKTDKSGIKLNDNLSYFHNQMLPQVVDPFRGLAPKLPRDKSFIVNATKVRFETLGTNNPKSPRTITSTGALTNPRYHEHMQTGVKALEMHTFGFTYVEIYNKKRFYSRPVMTNSKGAFSFDNKKYSSDVESNHRMKALILGDIHRAVMDKVAMAESRKQIRDLNPRVVVLHDYHDGKSINHHTAKSFLSGIARRKGMYDELEAELKDDIKYLKGLATSFPKTQFLIAESNHDEFIRTYIDTKQFIDDPQNILFISRLLDKVVNNPTHKPILQLAMELITGKLPKNVKFMKHDEEYRIGGKLVSFHGHKGMSGARGSPRTFEKANLKAVTGHTHSPMLYSNGAVVGHTTDLSKQDYARGGVNKWLQANVGIDELNKFVMLVLESNFK